MPAAQWAAKAMQAASIRQAANLGKRNSRLHWISSVCCVLLYAQGVPGNTMAAVQDACAEQRLQLLHHCHVLP
jgi:hypothetical protein